MDPPTRPLYSSSTVKPMHEASSMSPFDLSSTVSPLHKGSIRPLFGDLPPPGSFNDIDWGYSGPVKFDFKPYIPPTPRHRNTGAIVLRCILGIVGCLIFLFIIAHVRKGSRNRRGAGRVRAAAAVVQRDTPPAVSPVKKSEPGPPNKELPPPYVECASSGTNQNIREDRLPHSYPQHTETHGNKQQQNVFIENERRAGCGAMITSSNHSEEAPGMKPELLFDSGRVVETGGASDANVQEQTNRHTYFKDRVVYVDETDNLKVKNQK